MSELADIGLIGLAVMGQNLVLNMSDHGFRVAVFNRTVSKVDAFLAGPAQSARVIGTHSLEELLGLLKKPRRVMLMIKAGQPVDDIIERLLPHLEPGDIIIDGGNSNFLDTRRRTRYLEEKGLYFVGMGISGGEEGARTGPSMMPGGSPEAWPYIKDIFQSIAARVDGEPCCDWVGEDGAGHFVKMVHNGIEYGVMQLIAEVYDLMHSLLELDYPTMQRIFARWNEGKLNAYLVEITADILGFRDDDGHPLLEKILDAAGQKGTGRWTAVTALETGTPLTLIVEAVQARSLSAMKSERVEAAHTLSGPEPHFDGDRQHFVADLQQALYAGMVIAYAQGYMLMRESASEYGWNLNYAGVAQIWREGCIIRAALLRHVRLAFQRNASLANLLLDPYFQSEIENAQAGWRRAASEALKAGIPVPALAGGLTFFDGYRCQRLPANLIQAQRDYFGAHTYERVDRPRGEHFHTDWTGEGGPTTASSYQA